MDAHVFRQFIRQREELNAKVEAGRHTIDRLLAGQTGSPNNLMLANLELLLKERRDLLIQLAALDDSLMQHLLEDRAARDGPAAMPNANREGPA